ncbi:MAG: response regulator transcription factor [Gemmatimonadaceae bacterium]
MFESVSLPSTLVFGAPAEAAIRVLVVDDHTILREGLVALLSSQRGIEVVGQAGDGETAIKLFHSLLPDVSIVDLRMTPMDGVEVTRAMRESNPNARVILLTTYDTDEDIFRGLRAGASSYLLKEVDSAKLLETIRIVHSGRKSISPQIAAKLAEHVATDALTPRQMEVLGCLAKAQSNQEIANTLFISEGTVKAHVKAILQKLDARDRTQAITVALRRGLIRSL